MQVPTAPAFLAEIGTYGLAGCSDNSSLTIRCGHFLTDILRFTDVDSGTLHGNVDLLIGWAKREL